MTTTNILTSVLFFAALSSYERVKLRLSRFIQSLHLWIDCRFLAIIGQDGLIPVWVVMETQKGPWLQEPIGTHKKLGVIRGHQIYENGHQCDWFGPSYWLVWPHQGLISNLTRSWLELGGHSWHRQNDYPSSSMWPAKLVKILSFWQDFDEFLMNLWAPIFCV